MFLCAALPIEWRIRVKEILVFHWNINHSQLY